MPRAIPGLASQIRFRLSLAKPRDSTPSEPQLRSGSGALDVPSRAISFICPSLRWPLCRNTTREDTPNTRGPGRRHAASGVAARGTGLARQLLLRRGLDNGSDYESVACHKTQSATPTPTSTPPATPTNTPPPGSTPTPTPPPTATPPITDPATDVPERPDTGFAPGRVSALPAPFGEIRNRSLGDLWLEVPDLGIQIPIVGVPLQGQGWDMT